MQFILQWVSEMDTGECKEEKNPDEKELSREKDECSR